ncbi:hypothetical protein Tco_0664795, partial [Tanacetum coccineum]
MVVVVSWVVEVVKACIQCEEGDGVSNWTSSEIISKRERVMSIDAFHELEEVEELLEEEMLVSSSNHLLMVIWMSFGNGSSSGCHGGLWSLIEDEEDGEVVICIWREFIRRKSIQAFWVRIAEA